MRKLVVELVRDDDYICASYGPEPDGVAGFGKSVPEALADLAATMFAKGWSFDL